MLERIDRIRRAVEQRPAPEAPAAAPEAPVGPLQGEPGRTGAGVPVTGTGAAPARNVRPLSTTYLVKARPESAPAHRPRIVIGRPRAVVGPDGAAPVSAAAWLPARQASASMPVSLDAGCQPRCSGLPAPQAPAAAPVDPAPVDPAPVDPAPARRRWRYLGLV